MARQFCQMTSESKGHFESVLLIFILLEHTGVHLRVRILVELKPPGYHQSHPSAAAFASSTM